MTEPSILDARLAEIDRRLSTIQTELEPANPDPVPPLTFATAPEAAPAPEPLPLPPPTPLHPETFASPRSDVDDRLDVLIAQLSDLSEAHERLLELHRELLGQYASLLEHAAAGTVPAAATVVLEAGPFTNGRSLRLFEASLATLPDVEAVELREYLGTDRVMLEVRLNPGR